MKTLPYGFWIVGGCDQERRLVDPADAFLGYASLDDRIDFEREGFLSAFTFGEDFDSYLEKNDSVKGFAGACWSAWLWFDIDRKDDLAAAQRDAAGLVHFIADRFGVDADALLIFFSGSKGFHIGVPTALWMPEPSETFNRQTRRMAEQIARERGVKIDTGVYAKVQAFRAPNSRHPKTGLHKRRLTADELTGLSVDAIRQLAAKPEAFDLPTTPAVNVRAVADWQAAGEDEAKQAEAVAVVGSRERLNRATLEFIRDGATEGDRHRLLFSAAANFSEFGSVDALAHALLGEIGRDCGLSPGDTRRQIECGLQKGGRA